MKLVERVLFWLVDLLDGIVSAALYGHQGGSGGVYGPGIERQNQAKLRRWARGGTSVSSTPERKPHSERSSSGSQHFKL